MHPCPALIKAAKSLAPSIVREHGKVPYQKPQLKSMAHACIAKYYTQCISTMAVATQHEQSIESKDFLLKEVGLKGAETRDEKGREMRGEKKKRRKTGSIH